MLTPAQVDLLTSEPFAGRNRVGRALELAGVTQDQLARAVKKSQPQISSIVRSDYTDLPLETTRDIANFFDCSIEVMFPAACRDSREAVAS